MRETQNHNNEINQQPNKEKSLKFLSFNNINIPKIISEEEIESFRSEILTKQREAKRLVLLQKINEGPMLPEGFTSLEPFIQDPKHKESFTSLEQVYDYAKKIQTEEIKTPYTNDLFSPNLEIKLTLNIIYPKNLGDVKREEESLLKNFLKPPLCSENQACALEEHISKAHPALRALLNTSPDSIAKKDFPIIQSHGSALIKRHPLFFDRWKTGLDLMQEAQKAIKEALENTKGDINKEVQKILATYDLKALEYFVQQVQVLPKTRKQEETTNQNHNIVEKEYKLGHPKENGIYLQTKDEAISTAYKLMKKTCKHYKIESKVVKELEEHYKKKSEEKMKEKKNTAQGKNSFLKFSSQLNMGEIKEFCRLNEKSLKWTNNTNTSSTSISPSNLTPRPGSDINEIHEIKNPPPLPPKEDKPKNITTKKLDNGNFVIRKEEQNKTPISPTKWVKFVRTNNPEKSGKSTIKKVENYQEIVKQEPDPNKKNEKN